MPISESGRVVIEIDPKDKKKLHEVLKKENKTLKNWFSEKVDNLLTGRSQPDLFDD